jgi:predicted Zn finger-like uncharacterized protein
MQVIPASCPQCGTQYQLTPEHLAVANGKVRCGVCNNVFQAAPPAKSQPVVQRQPAPQNKSQFVNDADDLLLNDTGIRKAFDKKTEFQTGEFSSALVNSGDDDLIQDNLNEDENHNFSAMDDDFAMSEEFSSVGKAQKELHSNEIEDENEEAWASKLLDEEGIDAEKVIKGEDPKPKAAKVEPRQALGSSSDDFDFDFEGLDNSALSLSKSEEDELGFGTETKDDLIKKIKPEPLVFQIFNQRSLLSTIGLSIMGTIATLGIVLQLFFFQIDTLSRDPRWHSLYESVCGMVGCNLPSQFAIEDIKASNLTVKSHPHYRQSLIVDAIIVNHANIMQPFPNIELFFMDNDQQIIAARQFKPTEYLRGELTDASLMPSRQSVHLALEINDPGENASGYSIQLSY